MNLGDMIYAVKQGIQTMGAFTAELYLDEQIVDLINEKIETFVKQQFFKNKVQLPDGTFEITKEGLNNLQTLILTEEEANLNKNEDFTIDLDSGHVKFIISVDAFINDMPLDAPVRIVPHEELNYLLRNPFRTTSILSPIATIQDNSLIVYVKRKFIVNNLKITFIKEPFYFSTVILSLNDESDLPKHVHQTIVDMVVQSILEKNESPRYQQNVNENILNK
jgi:hypothetical protein